MQWSFGPKHHSHTLDGRLLPTGRQASKQAVSQWATLLGRAAATALKIIETTARATARPSAQERLRLWENMGLARGQIFRMVGHLDRVARENLFFSSRYAFSKSHCQSIFPNYFSLTILQSFSWKQPACYCASVDTNWGEFMARSLESGRCSILLLAENYVRVLQFHSGYSKNVLHAGGK